MKTKFILKFISLLTIPLVLLLVLILVVRDTQVGATEYYNIDIATTPANGFLIAENMAPGDKKTSILDVTNNGNLDFNYSVSSRQVDGDVNLFSKIILKVNSSNGPLYEGPISEFVNFALGTIAPRKDSSLTFIAELPLQTGNEVQGKSIKVAFDFFAIGHEEQIPIGSQCFEPPFSNSKFTLHNKSLLPIKFHLRDTFGNLEDDLLLNVRLEVTGPSIGGGTVKYVFKPTDGTLKFQKLKEPHYHTNFSTFDFPVIEDQWYTAKVYVDNKKYCQKTFQVLKKGNRSNNF
jgi:hypothetical protein